MKKHVWVWACLLCTLAFPALAQHRAACLPGENEWIREVSVSADGIVTLSDLGNVYTFDAKTGAIAECMPSANPDGFAIVLDGTLYCLEWQTGILAPMGGGGESHTLLKNQNHYAQKAKCIGDNLYFARKSTRDNDVFLCCYNMKTKKLKEQKVPGLYDYCVFKDDRILFLRLGAGGSGALCLLDNKTGKVTKLDEWEWDGEHRYGLAYDEKADVLYYLKGRTLIKRQALGAEETIALLPLPSSNEEGFAAALTAEGHYVVPCYSGFIYAYDMHDATPFETLAVKGELYGGKGPALFIAENPYVAVDWVEEGEDYDVAIVNAINPIQCFELPQFENEVLKMRESLKTVVMNEGKCVAVPCSLRAPGELTAYILNWEAAGIVAQIPNSFEELVDFVENYKGADSYNLAPSGVNLRREMETILALQYEAHCIRYGEDEALFGQMSEMLKKATASLPKPKRLPSLFEYGPLDLLQKPLPVYGLAEDRLIPCEMLAYTINKNSENKELAVKYIEACLRGMDAQTRAVLYEGIPIDGEIVILP